MIKLIITDMDGTFLNSQGDYNRALFQQVKKKMQKQGIHFAPCTGKQVERVEELLGEDSQQFWILGDSATRIKYQGKFVYQSLINNQLGINMITTLEKCVGEHVVIACTPECAFIHQNTPSPLKILLKRSYTNLQEISSYQSIQADFIKITVYDEKGQCAELRKSLHDFDKQAYIVVSESQWMDIANAGVHKGTTVARLQHLVGATQAETMVFGDGLNDIELMERGDFSFAMRNAFDETKAAANFITRSNDEDSVMKTILQILQLQDNTP